MTALMDRPADRRTGERRVSPHRERRGRAGDRWLGLERRRGNLGTFVYAGLAKLYSEVDADARIRRRLRVYVGGETA